MGEVRPCTTIRATTTKWDDESRRDVANCASDDLKSKLYGHDSNDEPAIES